MYHPVRQSGEVDQMKKQTFLVNTLLAAVLLAGLLVGMIWKVSQPNVVLPNLDIPAMAALILIALLLEYYMAGVQTRNWLVQIILAAVTFAVLPWAADLLNAGWKMALVGGAAFGILTFLFDYAARRAAMNGKAKLALVPTAFVMYLACQSFMGMIL